MTNLEMLDGCIYDRSLPSQSMSEKRRKKNISSAERKEDGMEPDISYPGEIIFYFLLAVLLLPFFFKSLS